MEVLLICCYEKGSRVESWKNGYWNEAVTVLSGIIIAFTCYIYGCCRFYKYGIKKEHQLLFIDLIQ